MLIFLGIIFMFIVGIYLTLNIKFIQFNPKYIIKSLLEKESNNGISPLQTLFISLASRIGVGSLSGTVLAIYIGGIGSVFWMWIVTLICSSNTLSESILSIIYRKKIDKELYEGGPFYYIKMGLNKHKLSIVYAIIFLITYLFGFTTIQSNTIGKILNESIMLNEYVTGIMVIIFVGIIIIGGIKEIAKTVSKLIPFMAIIYIIVCSYIIFSNYTIVDNILISIIKEAFNPSSFFVGFTVGIIKSIFSTEAGLGSGAIASSASSSNNPVSQGLIQVFGIYFDTFVIGTLTTFVVLMSDYNLLNLNNVNGIEITKYAFNYHAGRIGDLTVILAIILFGISTLIGSYYYTETSFKYIIGNKNMFI